MQKHDITNIINILRTTLEYNLTRQKKGSKFSLIRSLLNSFLCKIFSESFLPERGGKGEKKLLKELLQTRLAAQLLTLRLSKWKMGQELYPKKRKRPFYIKAQRARKEYEKNKIEDANKIRHCKIE